MISHRSTSQAQRHAHTGSQQQLLLLPGASTTWHGRKFVQSLHNGYVLRYLWAVNFFHWLLLFSSYHVTIYTLEYAKYNYNNLFFSVFYSLPCTVCPSQWTNDRKRNLFADGWLNATTYHSCVVMIFFKYRVCIFIFRGDIQSLLISRSKSVHNFNNEVERYMFRLC